MKKTKSKEFNLKGRLVPKLFTCMKGYSKAQFVKDIVAGLLVAIIAFPLSVALAISSGMSPETGLYSAIVGGFFVSVFGGSKVNIGGSQPTTAPTVKPTPLQTDSQGNIIIASAITYITENVVNHLFSS